MSGFVDVSQMSDWLGSQAVEDVAVALRQDSARFNEVAVDVEPTWQDLRAYFVTGSMLNSRIYSAGWRVTEYGGNVQRGGDNIAKRLEDCADRIAKLETRRAELVELANEANAGLYNNPLPTPELTDPNHPACDVQSPVEQAAEEAQTARHREFAAMAKQVQSDISKACKDYREIFEDVAHDLKSLDDDGSTTNPWLGRIANAAILVAAFIPPISTAAGVVAAGKVFFDEYQRRRRELLEEHPELSDAEISRDAAKTSAIRGAPLVALQIVVKIYTVNKLGQVVESEVAVDWAGNVVQELSTRVVGELPGNLGEAGAESLGWPPGEYPAATRSESTRVGPTDARPSGPFSVPAADAEARQGDPYYARAVKDYDGDGYTDPAFRPGGELEDYRRVKPPEVLVQPPPRPSWYEKLVHDAQHAAASSPPQGGPSTGPDVEPELQLPDHSQVPPWLEPLLGPPQS